MNAGVTKFDFAQLEKVERQNIFVALFAVINKGIADRDQQTNLNGITLLLNMIQEQWKHFDNLTTGEDKKEYAYHVHSIIDSLLAKISHKNLKLKSDALSCLSKISHFPLMDYAVQIDRVLATDDVKSSNSSEK